jgi:stage II sporulation protein D
MDAWSIGGETITIVGRGFGHGVGLCQYSAKQLADEGEKWPEIVAQFYPGAQLRRAY